MEEAIKNGHRIFFFEIKDIHIIQNKCSLNIEEILVNNHNKLWFKKLKSLIVEPSFFDVILIRKDPPFDQEYLHATQILNTFKSSKLKIYNGDKHPHEIQQPKIIDFAKLNKQNTVRQ